MSSIRRGALGTTRHTVIVSQDFIAASINSKPWNIFYWVVHSSVGDAGVVGRKLAVDFYGLNCPVGGGCPWGKCGTKADVTLNIAARYFALKELLANPCVHKTVYTKISCCIGQSKCLVAYFDEKHELFKQEQMDIVPSGIIHKLGLDGSGCNDMFFRLCRDGLFTYVDTLARSEARIKGAITPGMWESA